MLRTRDGRILRKRCLQGAWPGTQQFIGDFWLAPDDDLRIVARAFSGDIVEVAMPGLGI